MTTFSGIRSHKYTVEMALHLVDFLNEHLIHEPDRTIPAIRRSDCEMLPWEMIKCHPRTDHTIFTMNREKARDLENRRTQGELGPKLKSVVQEIEAVKIPQSTEAGFFRAFGQDYQELLLKTEDTIECPTTVILPHDRKAAVPMVLFFDDQGRDKLLLNGQLSRLVDQAMDSCDTRAGLMTVDLRGWGDTKPSMTPFDTALWASPQRWMAYVSTALGDHVLAMRIRDALGSLVYIQNRPEVDSDRIVVAGRGMGAVVATHVAAASHCEGLVTCRPVAGLFAIDMLCSFMALCEAETYEWAHDAFLADVLSHYDIPQLIGWLKGIPIAIADPLNAQKRRLSPNESEKAFEYTGKRVTVIAGESKQHSWSVLQDWLGHALGARKVS